MLTQIFFCNYWYQSSLKNEKSSCNFFLNKIKGLERDFKKKL